MAPKPFPFPIGVGVDICYLPRLGMILNKQDDYVTRWARKIFTRQEWPGLWQKFHETGALHITSSVPEPQLVLPNLNLLPYIKPDLRHQGVKKERSRDLIQDPQPPPLSIIISHQRWLLLAQYLGGRWAAKEAAVKASRQRSLHLKDISIVQANLNGRVHALVAPERTIEIVMSPEVAQKRGLHEAQSPNLGVYGSVTGGQFFKSPKTDPPHQLGSRFFTRRAKIKEEERQVAEISITHEKEYAVAVCMALDERPKTEHSIEYIVDDGSGEPLHEPDWSDTGFLEGEDPTNTTSH